MFESPLQKLIRESLEKKAREEQQKKNVLFGAMLAEARREAILGGPFGTLLTPVNRKVFISYHHGDEDEVKDFIYRWTEREKVFIPKALGVSVEDDIIDSTSPDYVMSQIRKKYLQDSTVTIVLIGSCTHSRRYVDWEIKTSLRQGEQYTPNGLLGVILPSKGSAAYLPPRFEDNWNNKNANCYARFYIAPTSATQLRGWIDDAHKARTMRVKYRERSSDRYPPLID